MNAVKCTVQSLMSLAIIATLILSSGCGGDGPVDPVTPAPIIDIFTASPNDIIPPDSALITWKARLADSVKLFPAGQKLNPKDSGQIYVKPAVPTNYKLVAYSGGGRDSAQISVVMSALAANIVSFRIIPDTVVIGDSSLVGWRTTQADSIVLSQGVGKVNPTDTGNVTVFLANTVTYRAVAFSVYGNDTVQINVRVKKPTVVRTQLGFYYKGLMGQSSLNPSLKFAVADAQSVLLDNLWINLRLLQGDGVIIPPDSVSTGATGFADVSYNFSGQLGHAVISANFRDVDTTEVYVRANTLILGIGGQGQYILFTEKYIDVKNFNGNPNAIDIDPINPVTYANYESNLNVVFAINDPNFDEVAQDTEAVLEVILTDGYGGKTSDSIGIGSTYDEIKSIYGQADTAFFSPEDPQNPPAIGLIYNSIGALFYIDTVIGSPPDTNKPVVEIHISDFVSRAPSGKVTQRQSLDANINAVNYRRFRK